MNNSPREIGARLKQFLAQRHLTQQALEKRLGIPQSQISRVCCGEIERLTPRVRDLCKFARIELKDETGELEGPAQIVKLINSITGGSRHRENLLVKLLKTGALLASGTTTRQYGSHRDIRAGQRRRRYNTR